MTHTCLNELWIVHPRVVASVKYIFSICSRVQNVLYVKNSSLFSFFNVLKKKCRLSLAVVFFINSVTNRCISNTLSTFNWQHFLSTEFLRLNDFLLVYMILITRFSTTMRRGKQSHKSINIPVPFY